MPMGRIQVDSNPVAGSHLLISSSANRLCVIIWAPASGTLTISNDPQPAGGQGFTLIPGQSRQEFWREDFGEMVEREWYVSYTGVISPAAFAEIMR